MRIWDIDPKIICRQHLLGEHRELHAIWIILTQNKKGYSNHPETRRWIGKLPALYIRHNLLVKEMRYRKYNHSSPLDKKFSVGLNFQDVLIDSIEKQKEILKLKKCNCSLD